MARIKRDNRRCVCRPGVVGGGVYGLFICSSGCDGKVVDFAVLGNVNVMGLHYSEIDSVSGVSPVARLAADDIALVENFYDLL